MQGEVRSADARVLSIVTDRRPPKDTVSCQRHTGSDQCCAAEDIELFIVARSHGLAAVRGDVNLPAHLADLRLAQDISAAIQEHEGRVGIRLCGIDRFVLAGAMSPVLADHAFEVRPPMTTRRGRNVFLLDWGVALFSPIRSVRACSPSPSPAAVPAGRRLPWEPRPSGRLDRRRSRAPYLRCARGVPPRETSRSDRARSGRARSARDTAVQGSSRARPLETRRRAPCQQAIEGIWQVQSSKFEVQT